MLNEMLGRERLEVSECRELLPPGLIFIGSFLFAIIFIIGVKKMFSPEYVECFLGNSIMPVLTLRIFLENVS